jgi:hypothetical protein
MSDRLAISAAFSVVMMAGYVLFSTDAVRMPIGPGSLSTPVSVSAPALPSADRLLPSVH